MGLPLSKHSISRSWSMRIYFVVSLNGETAVALAALPGDHPTSVGGQLAGPGCQHLIHL